MNFERVVIALPSKAWSYSFLAFFLGYYAGQTRPKNTRDIQPAPWFVQRIISGDICMWLKPNFDGGGRDQNKHKHFENIHHLENFNY